MSRPAHRPATEPVNARGKKIFSLAKAHDVSVTELADGSKTPFQCIYNLLHIPTYRIKEATARRLMKKFRWLTLDVIGPLQGSKTNRLGVSA